MLSMTLIWAFRKVPSSGLPALSKLHRWVLIQQRKCVFMDVGPLMLANTDELFDREEFSVALDSGWPDYFYRGLGVFQSSRVISCCGTCNRPSQLCQDR